ncbi:uncharacterized protein LOC128677583 [Plodia interpunctella]|uniref:uncharacterized protein LOC128677583 n=1 Tax=Plodia interpunctella TaxID=58824 RepID=UPI002367D26D|nr:uncharacterized protein LOC128677583 [Plodia interpunctella]
MEPRELHIKFAGMSANVEIVPHLNQTLKRLVESIVKPTRLRQDLMVTILLFIMKENGFVQLKDVCKDAITIEDYILSKKEKDITKYETVFLLRNFPNTPMKMIVSLLKDTILINATIPEMRKETYSLCLMPERYIINSGLGIPATLANVNELFVSFKDKIVTPVKSSILNCHRHPSGNLSGLPEDVILLIILKLSLRDVLNLSESCKRMYQIVNEDRVWYHLYVRDFAEHKNEGSWHDMYKEAYITRSTVRSRSNDGLRLSVSTEHVARCVSDSRWEVIL